MYRFLPALAILFVPGFAEEPAAHPRWEALRQAVSVHGTFSQAFLLGSGNNYMTMQSNGGTAKWSEGALNASVVLSDRFHAGAQVHSYSMGRLGRGTVQLDWAYGDYKVGETLGFRGGKIKTPMGLYTDVQDTDTVFPWAMLPQSIYALDLRSYNIPLLGGSIYGRKKLPGRAGTLNYQFFGGRRRFYSNDGVYLQARETFNLYFGREYGGPAYGFDLKWRTPVPGLTAGFAWDRTDAAAPGAATILPEGRVPYPVESGQSGRNVFLRYQNRRVDLAFEYRSEPHGVKGFGEAPFTGWYVMGTVHVTDKVSAGSYFSRAVGAPWSNVSIWPEYDPGDPRFFSNDIVLNCRYDLNPHLYLKAEGHYIDGLFNGMYSGDNPGGLQKITRLFLIRVGYTF